MSPCPNCADMERELRKERWAHALTSRHLAALKDANTSLSTSLRYALDQLPDGTGITMPEAHAIDAEIQKAWDSDSSLTTEDEKRIEQVRERVMRAAGAPPDSPARAPEPMPETLPVGTKSVPFMGPGLDLSGWVREGDVYRNPRDGRIVARSQIDHATLIARGREK